MQVQFLDTSGAVWRCMLQRKVAGGPKNMQEAAELRRLLGMDTPHNSPNHNRNVADL